ncbi:hypothetical protein Sjap_005646 [Stephania japonica]|uniref:Uncharacterized protein n=1 Tax=Stephania japonica TaxID=461633 RepID=A0AAP0K612_9MAGN
MSPFIMARLYVVCFNSSLLRLPSLLHTCLGLKGCYRRYLMRQEIGEIKASISDVGVFLILTSGFFGGALSFFFNLIM